MNIYKSNIIEKILINPEKTDILLVAKQGTLRINAYGDCCSQSWFEHFEGVERLIGSYITGFEQVNLGQVATLPDSPQECDKVYCLKITHSKGHSQIDLRNSSNGYYGGLFSFKIIDNFFIELKEVKWEEVIDDFFFRSPDIETLTLNEIKEDF